MLPVIHGIVKNMQPDIDDLTLIQTFKNIVAKEVIQRWHLTKIDPIDPSIPLLATFLDPQFKDTISFLIIHKNFHLKHQSFTLSTAALVSTPVKVIS